MNDSFMKELVKKHFTDNWKQIDTDIDFSNYDPISTSNSLHIYEERYEIEGKFYRLLYPIGYNESPLIELLV